MANLIPVETYIVFGTLRYDDRTYENGSEFRASGVPAEIIAQLRRSGALKLRSEALPPAEIEARLEHEQRLLARIAELEALVGQGAGGGQTLTDLKSAEEDLATVTAEDGALTPAGKARQALAAQQAQRKAQAQREAQIGPVPSEK